MFDIVEELQKLLNDASLYMPLLNPNTEMVRACIELTDSGETATVIFNDNPKVVKGCVNPDFKILMSRETFRKIIEGTADAYALAGRSRADETRPIEFEICNKEKEEELWEVIKAMLTFFFLPSRIKIRKLTPALAGEAHGANPIPLVYWNGLRSAWYYIQEGKILNGEGEKDPWPQLFIILKGKGKAIIGIKEIDIEPGVAIYVPPNSIHQIMAENDIELIWIAWKAK